MLNLGEMMTTRLRHEDTGFLPESDGHSSTCFDREVTAAAGQFLARLRGIAGLRLSNVGGVHDAEKKSRRGVTIRVTMDTSQAILDWTMSGQEGAGTRRLHVPPPRGKSMRDLRELLKKELPDAYFV